jgi:hypothetical protein
MTDDKRELGVLIVMRDKTYFVPGDPQEILGSMEKALTDEGFIGPDNMVQPSDIFRMGDEEIRELLNNSVTIVRGRK